jgi:2-oxoisovalerate dehydrogenase E2 component (dihydrolipoyl transacylase)
MSNILTFPMPDVGEGLTEAEVLTWHVAVGDSVIVNQIMVEIETAKAAVELPSPYAGVVTALLVEPGVTVDVGTPIISIDTDADDTTPAGGPSVNGSPVPGVPDPVAAVIETTVAEHTVAQGGAKIGEMTADGRIATLVGYVSAGPSGNRRARKQNAAAPSAAAPSDAAPSDATHTAAAPPSVAPPSVEAPAGVPVTPVLVTTTPLSSPQAPLQAPKAAPQVRKLAKDLGVDLQTVRAGRADGVITRAEVEAAAAPAPVVQPVATAAPAAGAPGSREQRIPVKGVRKMTAQAMVASAFTAPHVTEFLTVDVTAMMELRERLRRRPEFAETKLSPLAFAASAVCLASRRTPEINSVWDGDAAEIVVKNYVNLGIAAATPRGLVVPIIADADRMTLVQLAEALGALTAKARAGRTSPAEMSGGTFTITNVGIFGVDTGTPIINPGESAILALGSIKDAPWVVDGQLAVRKVCQLALSFDHRVIDGQQGSTFLADVGALLADPALSLLF